MKELLILTGACGVGKSTIAREWAKLKNGAIVDCDYLTEWIYNKDFPHWTEECEKFVAKLTSKIALEYLHWGMSTAIENVWSPTGIDILKNEIELQSKIKLKVIHLFCDIEENRRRDQLRIPDNQMKERVDIVKKELENYDWPEYVSKINTTNLTVEQTINIINQLKS